MRGSSMSKQNMRGGEVKMSFEKRSPRWGELLLNAGLSPHPGEVARTLGIPVRTLLSRLRRGDRGRHLVRPQQSRPWHHQAG